MKIWVYLNGIQQGPYTFDEISQMHLAPSTPVWYEGLPQWLPASEAPATASLFASGQSADEAASQPVVSQASTAPQPSLTSNVTPTQADMPAAPPTFIGWSVFLLLCCFPIGGLLGIIFSVMSGNAYRSGDYVRAKRLSESAEWCVIISIVVGLITAPLAIALL
ncbi:MAG: CD225/dispanin family protein [Muribaculaceae bacterium]|nr:CD225/dispanin family protein [Muribaculaceae bacterium]